MATPTKTASSRLLTMKFMQRAAASKPKEEPSTPTGPPSKRQRLSTSAKSSPAARSDLEAMQAAMAEEEAKREQALERAAAEAGETRWVLSFREPETEARNVLRVVSAGYADLDGANANNEDDEEDDMPQVGRMSFGKKPAPAQEDDSDSESSESDEEDGSDPATRMIREQRKEAARAKRKEKKKAEADKLAKMAKKRNDKKVKLNQLTSISNQGSGGGSPRGSNLANMECHGCGKKGHLNRDCPQRKRGRASLGD